MPGLTTPKQIRFLEGRGFNECRAVGVSTMPKRLIDRIAANSWRVPNGISPKTLYAWLALTLLQEVHYERSYCGTGGIAADQSAVLEYDEWLAVGMAL